MDPSPYTAAGRRALHRRLQWRVPLPGSGTPLPVLRARTWTFPVLDVRPLLPVPYAITGGVATRLYMQERDSDDLDIVVRAADRPHVDAGLRHAGAAFVGDHPAGGSRWLLPDGSALDVLAFADPWVAEALSIPVPAPDGQPVIALPFLVLMKLTACKRFDWGDLPRLVGDLDDDGLAPIREAVARYAPDAADDLEWVIERGRLEYADPTRR